MDAFLAIYLICFVIPVILGVYSSERNRFKEQYRFSLSRYYVRNKMDGYKLFVASVVMGCSVVILSLLPMAILIPEIKQSAVFYWVLRGGFLLGTVLGLFLVCSSIEKYIKWFFGTYIGKFIFAIAAISLSAFSSSLTIKAVEETVGYSLANFDNSEYLDVFFSALFVVTCSGIVISAAAMILLMATDSPVRKNRAGVDSEIKLYVRYGQIITAFLIFIGQTILLNYSIGNLKEVTLNAFVVSNFHGHFRECEGIPKGEQVAYLWRNNLDDNNILHAYEEGGEWKFKASVCHSLKQDDKTVEIASEPRGQV